MNFFCDKCKQKYHVADDKVRGRAVTRFRCKKCDNVIELQGSDVPPESGAGQGVPEGAAPAPSVFPSAMPSTPPPAPGSVGSGAGPNPARRPRPATTTVPAASLGAAPRPGAVPASPGIAPAPPAAPTAARAPAPARQRAATTTGPAFGSGGFGAPRAAASAPIQARTPAPTMAPLASRPQAPRSQSTSSILNASETGWYAGIRDLPVGPLTRKELSARVQAGDVTDDTLVWREGLDDWRPLRSVEELGDLFRAASQQMSGNLLDEMGKRPAPPTSPAAVKPRGAQVVPISSARAASAPTREPPAPTHSEEDDEATKVSGLSPALAAQIASARSIAPTAPAAPSRPEPFAARKPAPPTPPTAPSRPKSTPPPAEDTDDVPALGALFSPPPEISPAEAPPHVAAPAAAPAAAFAAPSTPASLRPPAPEPAAVRAPEPAGAYGLGPVPAATPAFAPPPAPAAPSPVAPPTTVTSIPAPAEKSRPGGLPIGAWVLMCGIGVSGILGGILIGRRNNVPAVAPAPAPPPPAPIQRTVAAPIALPEALPTPPVAAPTPEVTPDAGTPTTVAANDPPQRNNGGHARRDPRTNQASPALTADQLRLIREAGGPTGPVGGPIGSTQLRTTPTANNQNTGANSASRGPAILSSFRQSRVADGCWQNSLRLNPALGQRATRVVVTIGVNAQGRFSEISVQNSPDPSFDTCLRNRLRNIPSLAPGEAMSAETSINLSAGG